MSADAESPDFVAGQQQSLLELDPTHAPSLSLRWAEVFRVHPTDVIVVKVDHWQLTPGIMQMIEANVKKYFPDNKVLVHDQNVSISVVSPEPVKKEDPPEVVAVARAIDRT